MHRKENTGYYKNVCAAGIFVLAFLVLIVSCPLKRLLTNDFASQSSLGSKFNQSFTNKIINPFHGNNTNCIADVKETPSWVAYQFEPNRIDPPLSFSCFLSNAGFSIQSINNDISSNHYLSPGTHYFTIPLFLRHRRILI